MKKIKIFIVLSFVTKISIGQWAVDSAINLEVSGYTSSVILTAPTSNGGTFISIYTPNISGFYDMVVQYIDKNGAKQFGSNGIILQSYPANTATFVYNVMVDKQNNFIVCFQDQRNSLSNGVVAYRINTSGQSLWETNPGTGDGLLLGSGLSPYPCQLTDGDFIIAWNSTNNRINYQKINANGTIAWPAAKEILPITTGRTISRPQVVPHAENRWGMVFQQRNGTVGSPTPTTLFEKQFDSSGATLWTSTALTNAVTSSARYYSVLSNSNETYIGYYANPASQSRFDGYLQKVNGDGSLPWGINGSDFSTEQLNYESVINIAYKQAENEVWAVETYSNSGQSQYGVYAQIFNGATGSRLLSDNAKLLFPVSANREQTWPTSIGFCSDGNMMFMFYSDVTNYVYASKINRQGDFSWPSQRFNLNVTANTKGRYNFSVAGDEGVAVWQETRAGNTRAFAQNITSSGLIGGVIPVKIEYFTGSRQNNSHVLNWRVSCTNIPFVTLGLELSQDGRNYTTLYSGRETALRCLQAFDFTNFHPLPGNNFYRLKMMEDNGIISYSNIVSLNMAALEFDLVDISPNPVKGGIINLHIRSSIETKIELNILDITGRMMTKKSCNILSGFNTINLHVDDLSAGIYQVFGTAASGKTKSLQFIKE